MADAYQLRFIRDMVTRLTGTKNLTSKQKSWLDSLIDEGVPAPKGDLKLIERMEKALKVPGIEHIAGPLQDFLGRERKGWDLSEKQKAFRDRMLDEADDILVNGPWLPSEEQLRKLRLCVTLAKSRDGMYWSTHPGEGRALEKVQSYLDGGEHPTYIDQWSVERLIKCFRVAFREMDKPYAEQGSMIWTRVRSEDPRNMPHPSSTVVVPALIAGPPEVNEKGQLVYPVLADGELLYCNSKQLMKRKPKS
jgi:hypothetical protein